MEKIISYISENFDSYIEELKDFIRIPSISTSPENKGDINQAAEFLAGKLKQAGLNRVEIFRTEGHPIVYGEWLGAPGKPTVLVYGHYDVQPVDPLELWKNPPFEPVVEENKIWARGATDDKGQLFTHVKSIEAFFKTNGSMPLNIKFICEGEEEIGSENLQVFLKQHGDMLKCDAILISDTSLYDDGVPSLTYGLRGLLYTEVEVTGPNRDLHSGSFGGPAPNPINILADIISRLHDKTGKITVPDFYKDVLKISKAEKENIARLKFSDKKYAKDLGVAELSGEEGFSTLEKLWTRPTLDCNGIYGGFMGAGAKTVIPSKATAKISMRLVPNQDPKKLMKVFAAHIKKLAPKSVKVSVKEIHHGYPGVVPLESSAISAATRAMEKAFGKKIIYMREGGSIPIVIEFMKSLKAPAILMGFGLDSENLHSPNEHFSLKHFKLGMLSSAWFFDEFSKQ